METLHAPKTAINLTPLFYYQMAYTLISLLPPPLADTPELLYVRNHAAIARVGALKPVNANEADLAAQCVAARAQADDLLRLARLHAADIRLVARLNAQYMSMLRTATAVYKTLMRTQALRIAREKTEGAADQDAWTQHITEDYMMRVINPEHEEIGAARDKRERAEAAKGEAARPDEPRPAAMPPHVLRPEAMRPDEPRPTAMPPHVLRPAALRPDELRPEAMRPDEPRPEAAQPEAVRPEAARSEAAQPEAVQAEAAPVASVAPATPKDVSKYDMNALEMAFETHLSTIPWHQGPKGAERPSMIELLRQIMAEPRPPGRDGLANAGERRETADQTGDGSTPPV